MWTRREEAFQAFKAAGPSEVVDYTTLVTRHIPTWLSGEDVQTFITALTKETFNLFFLGINPYNGQSAGTAVLNYKDTETAARVKEVLGGWIHWKDTEGEGEWAWINTAWSSTQGLSRNILRYDHTVLFAEDIPDGNRPWVFDEHGERRSNHCVFSASQKPRKSPDKAADSDLAATDGADGQEPVDQRLTEAKLQWRYVRRRERPTITKDDIELKAELGTQEDKAKEPPVHSS